MSSDQLQPDPDRSITKTEFNNAIELIEDTDGVDLLSGSWGLQDIRVRVTTATSAPLEPVLENHPLRIRSINDTFLNDDSFDAILVVKQTTTIDRNIEFTPEDYERATTEFERLDEVALVEHDAPTITIHADSITDDIETVRDWYNLTITAFERVSPDDDHEHIELTFKPIPGTTPIDPDDLADLKQERDLLDIFYDANPRVCPDCGEDMPAGTVLIPATEIEDPIDELAAAHITTDGARGWDMPLGFSCENDDCEVYGALPFPRANTDTVILAREHPDEDVTAWIPEDASTDLQSWLPPENVTDD